MKNRILLFLIIIVGLSSCVPKLRVQRIQFNEEKGFYEYERRKAIYALRMQNGSLVERDSLKTFLQEVSDNDMHYNFDQKNENAILFIPIEKSMVNLYNSIQQFADEKNASSGLFLIEEFEKLCPLAYKYTDMEFYRAKFWEQLEEKDSAAFYYQRFLKFSEKKYSDFFRGNAYDPKAAQCFILERFYAKSYLEKKQSQGFSSCRTPLVYKYYYQSFSQGYVLNPEDFGINKKNILGIGIEYDNRDELIYGISNTWLSNENYIYRTSLSYSKNQFDLMLSGSYQLYKSYDNAFGLKISPAIVFTQFADSIYEKNSYFNPGISISAGYHFNQRWYIGASYAAFLFNQYTHSSFKKDYYLDNRYDISLYYQLIKGISLKAGIENGYPVIGFGFTGSSLGYFFRNKSFGVRMNYY